MNLTFIIESTGVGVRFVIGVFKDFFHRVLICTKLHSKLEPKFFNQVSMKLMMTIRDSSKSILESSVRGLPPPKLISSYYFPFSLFY